MSAELLARRAKRDPQLLVETHARATRTIRRGAIVVATTPVATALFYGLGHRLADGVLAALGMYVGLALGIGIGMITVGVRRRMLAASARRMLEAGRLPVAQLRA
jgi:hypothetical protein